MSDDQPAEVEKPASHDEQAAPSTAPEAQSQTAESSAAETPQVEEKSEKPNKVQERINQLTREKYELRQANADLDQRLKNLENPAPTENKPVPVAPKEDDFEHFSDYQAANSQFIAETASNAAFDRFTAQQQQAAQVTQQNERQQTLKSKQDSFNQNVDTKRANFKDFEDVAYGHPFMDGDLAEQIFDMGEKAPEVAYHLGSNLQEAERIFALTPVQRARELTKLEFQVEALAPKKVSGAPDPITPLGQTEAVGEIDPEKLTADEWLIWRRNKLEAKG